MVRCSTVYHTLTPTKLCKETGTDWNPSVKGGETSVLTDVGYLHVGHVAVAVEVGAQPSMTKAVNGESFLAVYPLLWLNQPG